MPGIIVVGAQWGDEGKGKAVDVFSSSADYVIRYQGGANAGHTLNIKGQKKVLHLIPSGIFHPKTICMIAGGVVLDISALSQEIKMLKAEGALPKKGGGRLLISENASILIKPHKLLDQAREKTLKAQKIGTTGRGIGPAYEDRASRKALLFGDLFKNSTELKAKLRSSLKEKKFLIENLYGIKCPSVHQLMPSLLKASRLLKPYRCADSSGVIDKALQKNKKVLFEGAQGALLDLWHGTYPYVTSSSTLSGMALVGCGMGPGAVQKTIAVAKAYTTRVGSGPFPTECTKSFSDVLQKSGEEWGATTGRRRRCGWLDLPALKYAIRINGCTELALMKLDVLSSLKEIPVCVSYTLKKGKPIKDFPLNSEDLVSCRPQYTVLPGWQKDISRLKSFTELPKKAVHYIKFIEKYLKIPVNMISIGAGREDTLLLKSVF